MQETKESQSYLAPDDLPLESKMVTRGIQSAQAQVEARNFEIRKNVLKYDDVLSRQRSVIYDERRRVLEGEDVADQIQHFVTDVVTAYVDGATISGMRSNLVDAEVASSLVSPKSLLSATAFFDQTPVSM